MRLLKLNLKNIQFTVHGGGLCGVVNLVWEIWSFNWAAKFTASNPGASAKCPTTSDTVTVTVTVTVGLGHYWVTLSTFEHLLRPETNLTLITGRVWQMGLSCIVSGTCG